MREIYRALQRERVDDCGSKPIEHYMGTVPTIIQQEEGEKERYYAPPEAQDFMQAIKSVCHIKRSGHRVCKCK